MGYITAEKPRVFGITLPNNFIKASAAYNRRDPDDGPDVDVNNYWTAAAFEMAAIVDETVCPAVFEFVDTKFGCRPCIVLATDPERAKLFQGDSELLKKVQEVLGLVREPHWYRKTWYLQMVCISIVVQVISWLTTC